MWSDDATDVMIDNLMSCVDDLSPDGSTLFGFGMPEAEVVQGSLEAEDGYFLDTLHDLEAVGAAPHVVPVPSSSSYGVGARRNTASSSPSTITAAPATTASSSAEAGDEKCAPIRTMNGDVLCFETFQGKIDIGKCVKMSLNSLNLGGMDGAMGLGGDMEDDTDMGTASASTEKKKRPRKPNPDSELISQATEQTLALMQLDPNSKEGKKQRRRIRNQMSAQLHRERKKQYIEALEDCVRERDVVIDDLKRQLALIAQADQGRSVRSSSRESSSDGHTMHTMHGMHSSNVSSSGSTTHMSEESDSESWTAASGAASPMPGYSGSSADEETNPRKHRRREEGQNGYGYGDRGEGEGEEEENEAHRRTTLKTGITLFSTALLGLSLLNNMPNVVTVNTGSGVALSNHIDPINLGDAGDWHAPEAEAQAVQRQRVWTPTAHAPKPSPPTPSVVNVVQQYKASDWRSPDSDLWRYEGEDALALLFPSDGYNRTATVTATTASSQGVKMKRHGNLRARASASASTKEEDERALVQMAPSWLHGSAVGDIGSRVLMTHGRALLDPLFLDKPQIYKYKATPHAHEAPPVSATKVHVHSSHRPQHEGTDAEVNAQALTVVTQPNAVAGSRDGVNTLTAAGPQLVMMLPASAVRWGSSWNDADDKDGYFADILRDLNSTDNADSNKTDSDGLWVEISCSVFKAQLVKDVNIGTAL